MSSYYRPTNRPPHRRDNTPPRSTSTYSIDGNYNPPPAYQYRGGAHERTPRDPQSPRDNRPYNEATEPPTQRPRTSGGLLASAARTSLSQWRVTSSLNACVIHHDIPSASNPSGCVQCQDYLAHLDSGLHLFHPDIDAMASSLRASFPDVIRSIEAAAIARAKAENIIQSERVVVPLPSITTPATTLQNPSIEPPPPPFSAQPTTTLNDNSPMDIEETSPANAPFPPRDLGSRLGINVPQDPDLASRIEGTAPVSRPRSSVDARHRPEGSFRQEWSPQVPEFPDIPSAEEGSPSLQRLSNPLSANRAVSFYDFSELSPGDLAVRHRDNPLFSLDPRKISFLVDRQMSDAAYRKEDWLMCPSSRPGFSHEVINATAAHRIGHLETNSPRGLSVPATVWLKIRAAVNRSYKPAAELSAQDLADIRLHDEWFSKQGKAIPYPPVGIPPIMFNPVTAWLNTPTNIPSDVTIDHNNRLTQRSVTDYALFLGVGGAFSPTGDPNKVNDRGRRRTIMNALGRLFINGATKYLKIPINGLRQDYENPLLPLLDRVLLAPPFKGHLNPSDSLDLRLGIYLYEVIGVRTDMEIVQFARAAKRRARTESPNLPTDNSSRVSSSRLKPQNTRVNDDSSVPIVANEESLAHLEEIVVETPPPTTIVLEEHIPGGLTNPPADIPLPHVATSPPKATIAPRRRITLSEYTRRSTAAPAVSETPIASPSNEDEDDRISLGGNNDEESSKLESYRASPAVPTTEYSPIRITFTPSTALPPDPPSPTITKPPTVTTPLNDWGQGGGQGWGSSSGWGDNSEWGTRGPWGNSGGRGSPEDDLAHRTSELALDQPAASSRIKDNFPSLKASSSSNKPAPSREDFRETDADRTSKAASHRKNKKMFNMAFGRDLVSQPKVKPAPIPTFSAPSTSLPPNAMVSTFIARRNLGEEGHFPPNEFDPNRVPITESAMRADYDERDDADDEERNDHNAQLDELALNQLQDDTGKLLDDHHWEDSNVLRPNDPRFKAIRDLLGLEGVTLPIWIRGPGFEPTQEDKQFVKSYARGLECISLKKLNKELGIPKKASQRYRYYRINEDATTYWPAALSVTDMPSAILLLKDTWRQNIMDKENVDRVMVSKIRQHLRDNWLTNSEYQYWDTNALSKAYRHVCNLEARHLSRPAQFTDDPGMDDETGSLRSEGSSVRYSSTSDDL